MRPLLVLSGHKSSLHSIDLKYNILVLINNGAVLVLPLALVSWGATIASLGATTEYDSYMPLHTKDPVRPCTGHGGEGKRGGEGPH
jgi:hypothetical protein